jgi:hypothetical protein
VSPDPPPDHPSLACRIVRLIPGEYELRETPLDRLPPDTYIEWAIVRIDSGAEIEVFDPFGGTLDHQWVGRRCLLELEAVFGACDLLPRHAVSAPSIRDRALVGSIVAYYRDGVAVDVGVGSVGVGCDRVDDRLEPGRMVRVSNHRLEFMRLLAVDTGGSPPSWERVEDPFSNLPRALQALRSETQTQYVPGIQVSDLKVTAEFLVPRVMVWGRPVAQLLYRLGAAGLREAEADVATFLHSEDPDARRAAAWVLSRYWQLPAYAEALATLAAQEENVRVREAALAGTGILLRGTRDPAATALLTRVVRDQNAHWFVREAAYLALLGVWLPETAAEQDTWRSWDLWATGQETTWDHAWAHRVNWDLVSRLARGEDSRR